MEITPSMIYWITRLDSIRVLLIVLTIVLGVIASLLLFYSVNVGNDDGILTAMCIAGFALICGLIVAFVPSAKEAAAMITIPKLANGQQINSISGKLLDLTDEWLDSMGPRKDK